MKRYVIQGYVGQCEPMCVLDIIRIGVYVCPLVQDQREAFLTMVFNGGYEELVLCEPNLSS